MQHDEPVLERHPARPKPWRDRIIERWRPIAVGAVLAVALVVLAVVLLFGPDHVADPGWLDDDASGEVVYCSGTDVSGSQARSVEDFNRDGDSGAARAKLVDDIPGKADEQYTEYLKRVDAGACDVLYLDVIYTPDFAKRALLYDMTSYLESRGTDSFDPKMMQTVAFASKLWGVPKQLDGGVIYYRKDRVEAPRTWKELARSAVPKGGEYPRLRFQLDAYEGLTVVFLELAYAANAEPIVSDDGKTANIDQPATRDALEFLLNALRRRAVPKSVTRLGDRGSLWAFSVGRAAFLRGWPYIEQRIQTDAEGADESTADARRNTARNLAVVPLPPWDVGGPRVGILGGHNLVIPRTAKNPEGALALIDFLTREEQVLRDARDASLAPVLTDLWDHEAVGDSDALTAVRDEDLRLRPLIPSYRRVSGVIYEALRRVLRNEQSPETVPRELGEIEADVQAVLDGD